jgi:uncharacterized protein YjdB
LDYVINKITGQYVKVGYQDDNLSWYVITGNIQERKSYYKLVKVKLWNIDWKFVQILSGLKIGDKICK